MSELPFAPKKVNGVDVAFGPSRIADYLPPMSAIDDLLAACKAFVEELSTVRPEHRTAGEKRALRLAEKAIAMAEGSDDRTEIERA